jgi:hypothetical protein
VPTRACGLRTDRERNARPFAYGGEKQTPIAASRARTTCAAAAAPRSRPAAPARAPPRPAPPRPRPPHQRRDQQPRRRGRLHEPQRVGGEKVRRRGHEARAADPAGIAELCAAGHGAPAELEGVDGDAAAAAGDGAEEQGGGDVAWVGGGGEVDARDDEGGAEQAGAGLGEGLWWRACLFMCQCLCIRRSLCGT